jgi:hypothetical protein
MHSSKLIRLITAFSIPLLVAVPSGATTEAEDLHVLVMDLPVIESSTAGAFLLLPFVEYLALDGEDDGQEPTDEGLDAETIVHLVRELVRPEQWEESGRFVDLSPDQRKLVAKAPAPVLQEVERFLEYLANGLGVSIELRVELYRAEAGPGATFDPIVEDREADRALRAALDQGSLSLLTRRILHLRPGVPAVEGSETRHSHVVDYDVEIAQSAIVFDPVSANALEGLRIGARVVPDREGGRFVELALRHQSLTRISGEALDLEGALVGGDRLLGVEVPREVQSADVGFASLATRLHLQAGKSAFLRAASRLSSGGDDVLVRVSVTSTRPSPSRYSLADGRILALYTGSVSGGGLATGDPRPDSLRERDYGYGRDPEEGIAARFTDLDPDGLEGLIWNLLSFGGEQGEATYAIGPTLCVVARAEIHDRIDKVLGELERSARGSRHVVLELLGEQEVVLARLELPVQPGGIFLAASGNQWTDVLDYDVEVAQNATVADPRVASVFDAFLANGGLGADSSDRLRIRLRAVANLLHAPATLFRVGGAMGGNIVQPAFDSVSIDRDLELVPGQPMTLTGLTRGAAGDDDMALRITIR